MADTNRSTSAKKIESSKEFQHLFFVARREHLKRRAAATRDSLEYKDAVAYAQNQGLTGAEILVDASVLESQGERDKALRLLDEHEKEISPEIACLVSFLRGSILRDLERYDEAIVACRDVTQDPTFFKPEYAWGNLGIALVRKGQIEQGIAALRKAVDVDPSQASGQSWNNLGYAYRAAKDYPAAIEAYKTALADNDPFNKATSLTMLAFTYYELGRFEEARAATEAGLEISGSDDPVRPNLDALHTLLQSDMKPEALSRDDRAMLERQRSLRVDESGPEARIFSKLRAAEASQYERYLQLPGSKRDNVISILRGWSSAVTLLEGSERLWRGGGYLIRWRGVGIGIDPGFDYLRNLHDAGYHGRDIGAVIVSHNHPDHNADLKSFDDLRYELYKRRHSDPHGGVVPYVLIWDADSQSSIKFSSDKPEHQFRPTVFDLGRCDPCDTITCPHDLPFSVAYFEVHHGDLRNAVGFRLALHADNGKDVVIGYTGDTEFFDDLPEVLTGCDLLIAHISQRDCDEFTDPKRRKKAHLGYRGMAELIKAARPTITLVGEFWAGLTDLRIELVQGLRRLASNESIYPAGLGMQVGLPSLDVECSECKIMAPYQQILVAPPANRFGNLSYMCPRCVLNPAG